MAVEYATFGVAQATRAGGVLAGRGYQMHRDFLDFIVDGRPLLLRLADLDGVSPLASDLGPSIFTSHVRGLLLETGPPLPGGRYVLYACPECEGLECGVVSAVIRREGTDVIWRDFAWQTAETVDPVRDGYAGIGPFRFRAEQYRAVLERLCTEEALAGSARRVLLVGRRVALFARLAAALRTMGIGAEITRDAVGVDAAELRTYGAVAFDGAVGEDERAAVRAAFATANADAVFVDTLAPLVPLLVAQLEQALTRTPPEQRRVVALSATGSRARVEVAIACRVRLTGYRQDVLRRTRVYELFEGRLAAGVHRLPVSGAFVVARTFGDVLVAGVSPG